MIAQVRRLHGLKKRKEDKAFDVLIRARAAVAEAEQMLAEAERRLAESAATLPARITAIENRVLGRIVEQDDLHAVKSDVAAEQLLHQALVDGRSAAQARLDRLRLEAEKAREGWRDAQRVVNKYEVLKSEIAGALAAEAEAAEESEVEDLFAKPGRKAA